MFSEIAQDPSTDATSKASKSSSKSSKKSPSASTATVTTSKSVCSTALKGEHLDAAQMLLKAGTACTLKDDEDCENTAIAVERVAADLIGLTTAVATALNRGLVEQNPSKEDIVLLKRWCEFYSQDLLPQTKTMIKKASPKLDAYGLFLPSRMGVSVRQDLLQKGLKGEVDEDLSMEGAQSNSVSHVVDDECVETRDRKKVPEDDGEQGDDSRDHVDDETKNMDDDEDDAVVAAEKVTGETVSTVQGAGSEAQDEEGGDEYDEYYDEEEEEYYDEDDDES